MSVNALINQMDSLIFASQGFGQEATYSVYGGASSSVYIVLDDNVKEDGEDMSYRITSDTDTFIWINREDIAAPKKGDRIAITGADTYEISSIESQDEFVTQAKCSKVRL